MNDAICFRAPHNVTWHRNIGKEDDLEIVKPAWKPEKKKR